MREIFKKINPFINAKSRIKKASRRKSKAQSMVEFAILLPLLIMLFSGMVEFGFMMNTYLSLLDATRQSARLYSNKTPFMLDTVTNTVVDDPSFYAAAAQEVVDTLAPPTDPDARQIVIDTTSTDSIDDVIISVLSVSVDTTANPDVISLIDRKPDIPVGTQFFSLGGNQVSKYLDADIEDFMTQNGAIPVETGILIVEVYYGYEGILGLPWVEMFMSEEDPIPLHASTVMPLVAAKP